MKVNLQLTAQENIFALLNAANPGKGFAASNVTLGTPTEATGTGSRNTQLTITAIVDAGYEGTQTVAYTRQALAAGAAIPTANDVPISLLPNDTDEEILTKVAAQLGLLESELTLTDIVKATTENNPGSGTLTAKAESLLYTGTYTVAFTTPDTDVPLSEAMAVTDLDGFDAEG